MLPQIKMALTHQMSGPWKRKLDVLRMLEIVTYTDALVGVFP